MVSLWRSRKAWEQGRCRWGLYANAYERIWFCVVKRVMVRNISVQMGKTMVPVWNEKRNLGVFVCVVVLLFYSGILRSSSTWMWALPQFFFFSGYPVDAFLFSIFFDPLVPGNASSQLLENSCRIRISICVRFLVQNYLTQSYCFCKWALSPFSFFLPADT